MREIVKVRSGKALIMDESWISGFKNHSVSGQHYQSTNIQLLLDQFWDKISQPAVPLMSNLDILQFDCEKSNLHSKQEGYQHHEARLYEKAVISRYLPEGFI